VRFTPARPKFVIPNDLPAAAPAARHETFQPLLNSRMNAGHVKRAGNPRGTPRLRAIRDARRGAARASL
jgi:hypothetical protein